MTRFAVYQGEYANSPRGGSQLLESGMRYGARNVGAANTTDWHSYVTCSVTTSMRRPVCKIRCTGVPVRSQAESLLARRFTIQPLPSGQVRIPESSSGLAAK